MENVVDLVNDIIGQPICPVGGGPVDAAVAFVAGLVGEPSCPAGGGPIDVACVDRMTSGFQSDEVATEPPEVRPPDESSWT